MVMVKNISWYQLIFLGVNKRICPLLNVHHISNAHKNRSGYIKFSEGVGLSKYRQ